ncbi:hypothetical protein, partial [Sedimentimonas flavescens]|uniref:hypothetical protein n=1 Tax=Sedimentimonas flavescens TaxID=2851012 RepID=UPI001C4A1FEE
DMLRLNVETDQTARISLQISINVKEPGNKINQLRLITCGAASQPIPNFVLLSSVLRPLPASRCSVCRVGEGLFTDHRQPPQGPFSKITNFSLSNHKNPLFR